MHAPNAVTLADRHASTLAQACRFADTSDAKIFVAPYLTKIATARTAEISKIILSDHHQTARFNIVFDRDLTIHPESMSDAPKGWFNAITQRDHALIYVSPTLLRAAMVSCSTQINFQEMNLVRLEKEIRPQLLGRALTVADVSGSVKNAERLADRMDACIASEMRFMLAHELAHGMLRVSSQAQADCVAAALEASQGRSDSGLFSSLIFATARNPDSNLCGMLARNKSAPAIVNLYVRQAALSFDRPALPVRADTVKLSERHSLFGSMRGNVLRFLTTVKCRSGTGWLRWPAAPPALRRVAEHTGHYRGRQA